MRYIKIKMEISDENYIFMHRALKQFLDAKKEPSFYQINSWKFIE